MSDAIIMLWRPNKKVHNASDNILAVYLCKHKHTTYDDVLKHYNWEGGKIGNQHIGLVDVRTKAKL